MITWVAEKYINMIGVQLEQFSQSGNSYNFRCPYCGDSAKNKYKKRGFLYFKNGKWKYFCHNCIISKSFDSFLKDLNPALYSEYKLETLKEQNHYRIRDNVVESIFKKRKPISFNSTPLKSLVPISELPENHPAKMYCLKRKLPVEYHKELYYADQFYNWACSYKPGKFSKEQLNHDEQRIVIPFLDEHKKLFGCQGRILSAKNDGTARYKTIMINEDMEPIYGLDKIDTNKPFYIVEGPFDSMFLKNALAVTGLRLNKMASNAILIYDNEPRNKSVVKQMKTTISKNKKIVIWPDKIVEKDINDMILSGMTSEQLHEIFLENTYQGLSALTKFNVWKRVGV